MKFSAIIAVVALPILAVATPAPAPIEARQQSCSTGSLQCCSSVQTTSSGGLLSVILGLLGVIVGADVPIGVTCSPITIIGVSGTNCASQTVCCENNSFNGVVAVGCTPINLGL